MLVPFASEIWKKKNLVWSILHKILSFLKTKQNKKQKQKNKNKKQNKTKSKKNKNKNKTKQNNKKTKNKKQKKKKPGFYSHFWKRVDAILEDVSVAEIIV